MISKFDNERLKFLNELQLNKQHIQILKVKLKSLQEEKRVCQEKYLSFFKQTKPRSTLQDFQEHLNKYFHNNKTKMEILQEQINGQLTDFTNISQAQNEGYNLSSF